DSKGPWKDRMKLSEQMVKMSNPGILQVKRLGENLADVLYDVRDPLKKGDSVVDPLDPTHEWIVKKEWEAKDLLEPIFRSGKRVYSLPSLEQIRDYTQRELAHFPAGIKRILNPHHYFVGMKKELYNKKIAMIRQIRQMRKSHP